MLPSKCHFFQTIIHQLHGKSKKMYRQTTKQDYLEIVCNVTVWRCWLSSTHTTYGLAKFDFLCCGLVILTRILFNLLPAPTVSCDSLLQRIREVPRSGHMLQTYVATTTMQQQCCCVPTLSFDHCIIIPKNILYFDL